MNRLRVLRQLRGLHSGRPLQAFPTLTDNASIGGQTPSPLSAPSITDSKINELASKPIHLLTLSDLVKRGSPPLSADALLSSATYTSSLIPIRLAHRVRALRNLPFIVVSNPHIARIYGNYLHSLETLISYHGRRFTAIDEEVQFTDALADLVQTHTNTIPVLARGFLECRKYISPEAATQFLDQHLRARIGTRLIAEQHIALHLSSQPHTLPQAPGGTTAKPSARPLPDSSYIGVIDTALRPASILSLCEGFVSELCELRYGVRPSVIVTGDPSIKFSHVPRHIEYILTELLKNAFRATVENGKERDPIEVTIALSQEGDADHDLGAGVLDDEDSDSARGPHVGGGTCGPSDETLTIRIRDRGGGIAPNHLPYIWTYNFTTFNNGRREDFGAAAAQNSSMDALNAIAASATEPGTIAGLGYGLPLSRAYAEYFGGSIALQSLWGWGTDVYLRLKGLRGF